MKSFNEIDEMMKEYKDLDFGDDQMAQIRLGLAAGVDVSVYADTKFDGDQMYEIRKKLEKEME